MYENNPDYQEYPEVTPDAGTIEEPNDHKKAVATAVGGSVVLGAAAYGLSLLDDANSAEAPVSDDASSVAAAAAADARAKASLPVVPVVMPVESELDKLNWPLDRLDELTFPEAFAAARHQMGPAHHFTWHVGKPEGGLFNTYFQEEEAKLTPQERAAFIATLPTEGDSESASTHQPDSPARVMHPSVEGHHHAAPVAEPQLASVEPEPHPLAAVAPTITVVPLAAVAEANHEVTPLAATPEDNSLLADHDANAMHHSSLTSNSIESVDHHVQFDHDSSHEGYDGMDQHHLGE